MRVRHGGIGRFHEAMTLARTTFVCADNAGHLGMRALAQLGDAGQARAALTRATEHRDRLSRRRREDRRLRGGVDAIKQAEVHAMAGFLRHLTGDAVRVTGSPRQI